MEPTEARYSVLNALETLDLLQFRMYDEEGGFWVLLTISLVLLRSYLLQNGEIFSFEDMSEL